MFNIERVKSLTNTELKVYDYILQHSPQLVRMNVREIAMKTHVSPATVTRTVSKLGFENMWEFKLFLKDQDNRTTNKKVFETTDIIEEFFKRSLTSDYAAKIEEAVRLIAEADLVLFFGIGSSGDIASYAARQFSNMGQSTFIIQDPYYPFHLISKKYEKVVSIICSVSGETPLVLNKVDDMKKLGSRIVSVTNSSGSTLAKISDVNLAYHITDEYLDEEVNVTSQIPAVFLLETLARRTYNYQQQNSSKA